MSCFCCGGGSSFGYKLAGYDVVACNEIDPKVMKMYLKITMSSTLSIVIFVS